MLRRKNDIDLKYYVGKDQYSDGEIEDEILNIVDKQKNLAKILENDNHWPILYHLSPERRNLLEWYPFKKASLLEIGAGCGALTGLFCEKLKKVTALELSKKRATIISKRYKNKKNLKIYVGDINEFDIKEKFDYITLIGVLEYAGKYGAQNNSNPYIGILNQIKKMLKPGGTLLIAIENKFGLKYWAGAREDHTGRLFENLEDYPSEEKIRTFGKYELTQLLKTTGFAKINYYYPMPDYKLPSMIFSDKRLPTPGELMRKYPSFDRERYELFNEYLAFENLIKNNQFEFFANSFLVECKNE